MKTGEQFGGGYLVDIVTDHGKTYTLVVSDRAYEGGPMTWKQAKEHAAACREGGHDDWKLPSRRDALTLAEKLLPCGNDTPDTFRKGGEQALAQKGYWTGVELEASPGAAWVQDFGYGRQDGNAKNGRGQVRAVRHVPIGEL